MAGPHDPRAIDFPEPDDLPEPEQPKPKPKPRSRTSSPAKSKTTGRNLEIAVADTLKGIGMGVTFFNEPDGTIITGQADDLAAALVRLADRNSQVRRILVGLTTGGAWGEVLSIVLLGIVLPIAGNHGIGPLAPPTPALQLVDDENPSG